MALGQTIRNFKKIGGEAVGDDGGCGHQHCHLQYHQGPRCSLSMRQHLTKGRSRGI